MLFLLSCKPSCLSLFKSDSLDGDASSAAAVGVAARVSATKSQIVKSVSCPTPLIVGMRQLAIARATASSLNCHKSSMLPPPRQIISTSHSFLSWAVLIALAICTAAPFP